jgi:hypothetical protein
LDPAHFARRDKWLEDFVKRLAFLAFASLLCFGASVRADDAMKKDDGMKSMHMMTCKGTITKMDKDGKMMVMKDAKGKETTCYWDANTKVTGDMKEGAMATVKCTMNGDKMMATDVHMWSDKKAKM